MAPLKIPKYPEVILTPPPQSEPDKQALVVLEKQLKNLLGSSETYSVTYSPVLCPYGKNWLFTLKPYFWERGGKWERRDGKRNPYCDAPQGQKQLTELSMAVRTLALGQKYLSQYKDTRQKAEQLLQVFFIDPETRMKPEVLYSQCYPGEDPMKGDDCFVVAARYLLVVSQYLSLLDIDPSTRSQVQQWLSTHVNWIRSSDQGAMAAAKGNNVSVWYHALIASHLSLVEPQIAADHALGYFEQVRAAHPDGPSYFEKELRRTRPRHYVLFALEPTFILAAAISQGPPPQDVLAYLDLLVSYAGTVPPGDIEVDIDADQRYFAKLAWFTKMLDRWNGRKISVDLDGSGWEGGWNMRAKLSWGLI